MSKCKDLASSIVNDSRYDQLKVEVYESLSSDKDHKTAIAVFKTIESIADIRPTRKIRKATKPNEKQEPEEIEQKDDGLDPDLR